MLKLAGIFVSSAVLLSSQVMDAATYTFDNSNAIHWVAKKVVGGHNGEVKLIEGKLDLESKTEKGRFVLDMKSINSQDLTGEWKTKLESHLKSADFFEVEKEWSKIFNKP